MGWESIFDMFLTKETIFLALFLWMLWVQQQEKKAQNDFILKQQDILSDLSTSVDRMATNQEKLTERIEKIEVIVDRREEKRD